MRMLKRLADWVLDGGFISGYFRFILVTLCLTAIIMVVVVAVAAIWIR